MKHKNDIIMSAFIAALMASTITPCNGDSNSKKDDSKAALATVTTPTANDNTEKSVNVESTDPDSERSDQDDVDNDSIVI